MAEDVAQVAGLPGDIATQSTDAPLSPPGYVLLDEIGHVGCLSRWKNWRRFFPEDNACPPRWLQRRPDILPNREMRRWQASLTAPKRARPHAGGHWPHASRHFQSDLV